MSLRGVRLLIKHFRETRGQFQGLLKIWGGGFLIVITGSGNLVFHPACTSKENRHGHRFRGCSLSRVCRLAVNLRRNGVTLELRETNGSVENYHVLQDDPEVDLAIVKDGTAPPNATEAGNLDRWQGHISSRFGFLSK